MFCLPQGEKTPLLSPIMAPEKEHGQECLPFGLPHATQFPLHFYELTEHHVGTGNSSYIYRYRGDLSLTGSQDADV